MENMMIVGLIVLTTIIAQPFLSGEEKKQVSPAIQAQVDEQDEDEEEPDDDDAVVMDDEEDDAT
jgi:hypothetical protein